MVKEGVVGGDWGSKALERGSRAGLALAVAPADDMVSIGAAAVRPPEIAGWTCRNPSSMSLTAGMIVRTALDSLACSHSHCFREFSLDIYM